MIEFDDMLTEREAAEVLRVSHNTLNFWRTNKKGPPYFKTFNGSVRYSKKELIEFLEQTTTKVNPNDN